MELLPKGVINRFVIGYTSTNELLPVRFINRLVGVGVGVAPTKEQIPKRFVSPIVIAQNSWHIKLSQ
jgi:hypothetical protein